MVLVPPERVAPPGKGSARSCVSMPHGRRESHAQHLALLVSVAGFGWTIFEWQRSRARIRAKGTSFVAIGRPALGTALPERPIAKLLRTVGEHDTLRQVQPGLVRIQEQAQRQTSARGRWSRRGGCRSGCWLSTSDSSRPSGVRQTPSSWCAGARVQRPRLERWGALRPARASPYCHRALAGGRMAG